MRASPQTKGVHVRPIAPVRTVRGRARPHELRLERFAKGDFRKALSQLVSTPAFQQGRVAHTKSVCIMAHYAKTIKLEAHLSPKELKNRYRKVHDRVLSSHYQILWLIGSGKSTTEVMEVTGYSRGWIQQLARRCNALGEEALGDRRLRNPGARDRALLSAQQREQSSERRSTSPRPTGDVELQEGRRVDRVPNRQEAKQQEQEGLGVPKEDEPKLPGSQAPSRIRRRTRAGGL